MDDIKKGNEPKFSEKKQWVTGKKLINEASNSGYVMPIIFATAEDTSNLYGWAELVRIEVGSDKTDYYIRKFVKFRKEYSKTLVRKMNGENISERFIRPYALCLTPYDILSTKR